MDLSAARWRKSTWSGGDGGECVEVAGGPAGVVAVRDSKNPHGPVLLCGAGEWKAFLGGVRGEAFG
ncbi:DUF397 domain-containing protein [Sphaerisporangium dianthi]|uniref:DUF397 domain-containing protein n=1 Tax=Sphaerisporangium dianthi TaxID=1436120 RepID=A0ABV9CGP2_9ACTN